MIVQILLIATCYDFNRFANSLVRLSAANEG